MLFLKEKKSFFQSSSRRSNSEIGSSRDGNAPPVRRARVLGLRRELVGTCAQRFDRKINNLVINQGERDVQSCKLPESAVGSREFLASSSSFTDSLTRYLARYKVLSRTSRSASTIPGSTEHRGPKPRLPPTAVIIRFE